MIKSKWQPKLFQPIWLLEPPFASFLQVSFTFKPITHILPLLSCFFWDCKITWLWLGAWFIFSLPFLNTMNQRRMLNYCLVLYNVGLGLVYLCVCKYRYMFKCDMYTWRQRSTWVFMNCSPHFFFFLRQGCFLTLKCSNLAKLAGQEALGIFLPPTLQCWDYRYPWLYMATSGFYICARYWTRVLIFCGKHLTD